MIPELAIWIVAVAVGIIALPTLLVLLAYLAAGLLLASYKFVEAAKDVVQ